MSILKIKLFFNLKILLKSTLQKQDMSVQFPSEYLYPFISTSQFWSEKLYFCFLFYFVFAVVTVTVEIHVSKVLRVTVGCTALNGTSVSLPSDSENIEEGTERCKSPDEV